MWIVYLLLFICNNFKRRFTILYRFITIIVLLSWLIFCANCTLFCVFSSKTSRYFTILACFFLAPWTTGGFGGGVAGLLDRDKLAKSKLFRLYIYILHFLHYLHSFLHFLAKTSRYFTIFTCFLFSMNFLNY